MTTEEKLEVAIAALKEIKALKETSYGDHWSTDKALRTEDVHDICDQALCFCLPIEDVRKELIEQGIDTGAVKEWMAGRLAEIRKQQELR